MPTLQVIPTGANHCAAAATHAIAVHDANDESVDLAPIEAGETGEQAARAAADHGVTLEVVAQPGAKRGLHSQGRRRTRPSNAGVPLTNFRANSPLATTCAAADLTELHSVVFSVLLLRKAVDFAADQNSLPICVGNAEGASRTDGSQRPRGRAVRRCLPGCR